MKQTDFYIYWKNIEKEHGIFNIKFDDNGYILLRNMKGKIDDDTLCNIILSWTPIKSMIVECGKTFNKKEPIYNYFTEHNENGEDEFISYSKYERIKIWHKNDNDEFDQDMKIFIPDLFNYVEIVWEGKFSNTESIDNLKKAAANVIDIECVRI